MENLNLSFAFVGNAFLSPLYDSSLAAVYIVVRVRGEGRQPR